MVFGSATAQEVQVNRAILRAALKSLIMLGTQAISWMRTTLLCAPLEMKEVKEINV